MSQNALTSCAHKCEWNKAVVAAAPCMHQPHRCSPSLRHELHPVYAVLPLLTSLRLEAEDGEGYKINDGANSVFIIRLESNATPF